MIRQLSIIAGILVFISFSGLDTVSAKDTSPDKLQVEIERYEQAVSDMKAKLQATESDDDKTSLSAILFGLNSHLASLKEKAGDLGGHTNSPPEPAVNHEVEETAEIEVAPITTSRVSPP